MKDFVRDEKEILQRCKWLAHKGTDKALFAFSPTMSNVRQFKELEREPFIEMLGYSMSFVMSNIYAEIRESYGWSDKEVSLALIYHASLGRSLDEIFGYKGEEGIFINLLDLYSSPDYDENYEEFWGIDNTDDEKLAEDDKKFNDDFNSDKLYVYRLGKIVNFVNRDKVLENALNTYRNIALSCYDDAFFNLHINKLKQELSEMLNRQEESK